MRPISPNTGAPEQIVAEDQLEYLPLPVASYHHNEDPERPHRVTSFSRVTAWVPTREELDVLARDLAAIVEARGPLIGEAGHAAYLAVVKALFQRSPIYLMLRDFGQPLPLTPHMVSVGMEAWMRVKPATP